MLVIHIKRNDVRLISSVNKEKKDVEELRKWGRVLSCKLFASLSIHPHGKEMQKSKMAV